MTKLNRSIEASAGKGTAVQKGHVATKPDSYDSVTGTGRWKYESLLGYGSYGRVWKVVDMLHPDKPFRALKICRFRHGSPPVFQLHREAQYSLRYIHNPLCETYDHEYSMLFVRYLEDCTSFRDNTELEDTELQYSRKACWTKSELAPSTQTTCDYVVMEYCDGRPLRWLLRKAGPTVKEARQILIEAASALDYLSRFKPALVHRDFRSANMLWMKSRQGSCNYRLKVLDLGLMLPHTAQMSDDKGVANAIAPTQYNYWVPKEAMEKTAGRMLNFAFGNSSAFDVFSLGMLAYEIACPDRSVDFRLQVTDKRDPCHRKVRGFWCALGMDRQVLASMIHENWSHRPAPERVHEALTANPKILVNFNERMGKDQIAACQYIGCMGIVGNMKQDKLARALKLITAWVVHSTPSFGLTVKQLTHVAFRKRHNASIKSDLLLEAFDQLTIQFAATGEVDSTKVPLVSELENVKKQFNALVAETKADAGCRWTDEQEEQFHNKKNLIITALDNIFPHIARDTREKTRNAPPCIAPTQGPEEKINENQDVPAVLPCPAVTNLNGGTPMCAKARCTSDGVVPQEKTRERIMEGATPQKEAKCRVYVDNKREHKNGFEPRPPLTENARGSPSKTPQRVSAECDALREECSTTQRCEQQVPRQGAKRQRDEDSPATAVRAELVKCIVSPVAKATCCSPRHKLSPLKSQPANVTHETESADAKIALCTKPSPSRKRVRQDAECEMETQGEPKKCGRVEVTPETQAGSTSTLCGSGIHPEARADTSFSGIVFNAMHTGVGCLPALGTEAERTEDTSPQKKSREDGVKQSCTVDACSADDVAHRVDSHTQRETPVDCLENSTQADACVDDKDTHAHPPKAVAHSVMHQFIKMVKRVERERRQKRLRMDSEEGIDARDTEQQSRAKRSREDAEDVMNDAVPKHSKFQTLRFLMQNNYSEYDE